MTPNRIAKALALVIETRNGQKREETSVSYIVHSISADSIALDLGANEKQEINASFTVW